MDKEKNKIKKQKIKIKAEVPQEQKLILKKNYLVNEKKNTLILREVVNDNKKKKYN